MGTLETYRWDTAEFLTSEESIAAYLQLALEDSADDPASLLEALRVVARARGMAALAREIGITREGLYKALSPTGNPSFTTVMRLARALGLTLSVRATSTVVPSSRHSKPRVGPRKSKRPRTQTPRTAP